MSTYSEDFRTTIALDTVAAACLQAASDLGLGVQVGTAPRLIFVEPTNFMSFHNPATVEVILSTFENLTQVTLNGSNMGFGPLQSGHVKDVTVNLRQKIETLSRVMGVDNSVPPRRYPDVQTQTQVSPPEVIAPPAPAQHFKNIFMSYRRADSADVTGRIYDRLVVYFGEEAVFKDVDDIPLGVDFRKHLDRVVGGCQVLLSIIGDQWLSIPDANGRRRLDDPGDFVRIEIESALRREIPVIPLLVRNAEMPTADDLPESLRELAFRNGIPIRHDPDFNNDVDRLIRGLEGLLGA